MPKTNTATSERRRASSRANGAKSRGPATSEGKARSSRNAFRHGLASSQLLAASVCLFSEDREQFETLHRSLVEEFQPVTASENHAIEEMAVCRWRQQRGWLIENTMYEKKVCELTAELQDLHGDHLNEALRLTAAFEELAACSPALALVMRYETRLSRQYDRALRRFLALRAERLLIEPSPENEQCHESTETECTQPVTEQPAVVAAPPPKPCGNPNPVVTKPPVVAPVPDAVTPSPDSAQPGAGGDLPRAA